MMWGEGRAGLAGALRALQGAATILVLSLAGAGGGLAQPAAATKAAPGSALQLERRVVATAVDAGSNFTLGRDNGRSLQVDLARARQFGIEVPQDVRKQAKVVDEGGR